MPRYLSRLAVVLTALALVSLSLPAGRAARVKVWHHHSAAHFDKAQFKHAIVSNEGALQLARELKPLPQLDAMHVWDVVEDRQGNLFVATGDEGKIYKVPPAGKASVVYTSTDSQILCLAVGPDGTVYAGTGPNGLVVALPPAGQPKVIAENLDNYVWCLALDPQAKALYAGTGPRGRIYQVTPDANPCVFYATKQDHILCMARGKDGMLYAGTDKGGLVYRIDAQGKGFVLYSTGQSEVRSLLVSADGVYAGTSAPVKRRPGGANAGAPMPTGSASALGGKDGAASAGEKPKQQGDAKDKDETKAKASAGSDGAANENDEPAKKNPAAAPTPPAAGDNSLYRIAPDGTVRELFREKAMLLSLLRYNGRVLVGTGMQAQLFEIDEATKERSEIARLDHGQIHCLCQRKDGSIVLGTGDPGKLYALQDKFAAKGTVVSDVLDAKIISKWGAMTWKPTTPPGTRVTVALRAGNTPEPDETWSDWSAGGLKVPSTFLFPRRISVISLSVCGRDAAVNRPSTFTCVVESISPISSRKIVPPLACSKRPMRRSTAPVNDPFSCPKSGCPTSAVSAGSTWRIPRSSSSSGPPSIRTRTSWSIRSTSARRAGRTG